MGSDYTEGFWDGYKAGVADKDFPACHFCGMRLAPQNSRHGVMVDPATGKDTAIITCVACVTPPVAAEQGSW